MLELRDFLLFVTTTGAALATYWLLDEWFILSRLSPKEKRWVAVFLTAAIALAAWGAQVAMLYAPQPANWREWVERGFGVAGAAVGLNQLIHGRDLGKRAPEVPPPTGWQWSLAGRPLPDPPDYAVRTIPSITTTTDAPPDVPPAP